MSASTMTILGKEYPVRFSLRVMRDCCAKFGSMEGLFRHLTGVKSEAAEDMEEAQEPQEPSEDDKESKKKDEPDYVDLMDTVVWLIWSLLDAGYRYSSANGDTAEVPPPMDLLWDVIVLKEAQQVALSAIIADSGRTVEAESEKNGESGETAETTES